MIETKRLWWKADKGEVNQFVLQHAQEVESNQSDIYDRFVKLSYLYDPNDPFTGGDMPREGPDSFISENVVASNVDTAYSAIASTDVRARHHTDDGDWSMQRRARHLDWYGEALSKLLEFDEIGPMAFKSCEIKGTGLVKFSLDRKAKDPKKRICAHRVLVDNIVVDQGECLSGRDPMQIHERVLIDREKLIEMFPDKAEEISRAQRGGVGIEGGRSNLWAEYREVPENQIVYVESFYRGKRHTVCIDGEDLLDEPWPHDWFPYCEIRWSKRERGWHGIGLAERIVGHQRVINNSNFQEDRLIRKLAHPTTYVSMADAKLSVRTVAKIGDTVVYKDKPPVTVIPQAVPREIKERRQYAKESAYNESGVSQDQATSQLPKGLETGAAVREVRESRQGRFAQQAIAYERFRLDMVWMALQFAKMLGDQAPEVVRRSRLGPRKFKWADVDMGEVKVQMSAASTLPRTSAGRIQLFLEAAQAGVITTEEARMAFDPHGSLDFEHQISLFSAAKEAVEDAIEEILDGRVVVPEPYHNLAMCKWMGEAAFNRAEVNGAPESVLEGLRTFANQAAYQLSLMEPQPSVMAGDPTQVPMMQDPSEPPPAEQPQAALAPEAMQLLPQ